MNEFFTIRHANRRTTAVINGLAPGGSVLRPYIIPVFIPLAGCPHRCSFCNQTVITGADHRQPSPDLVETSVQTWRAWRRDRDRPVEIAFYGGNFLGLPVRQVANLLTAAQTAVRRGVAAGIRFSTRPDTITPESLGMVRDFPVTTIELGLQSMDDRVLSENGRGHTAACTTAAARQIKSAGHALGLQMMTGLPGDTAQGAVATAEAVIRMAPDAVRIYPTLVLQGSPLAQQFRRGDYCPMTLEETISLVSRLFLKFTSAGIPVIRMGLQAEDSLSTDDTILAGPYHPAFGEQVLSRIFGRLAAAALAEHPDRRSPVRLRVHPRHLSPMMGVGRRNLHQLQARFPTAPLTVRPDAGIAPHHLEVDNPPAPIAIRSCPT